MLDLSSEQAENIRVRELSVEDSRVTQLSFVNEPEPEQESLQVHNWTRNDNIQSSEIPFPHYFQQFRADEVAVGGSIPVQVQSMKRSSPPGDDVPYIQPSVV